MLCHGTKEVIFYPSVEIKSIHLVCLSRLTFGRNCKVTFDAIVTLLSHNVCTGF